MALNSPKRECIIPAAGPNYMCHNSLVTGPNLMILCNDPNPHRVRRVSTTNSETKWT